MKNNIIEIRKSLGLSQTALSLKAQISQSVMSLLERGQRCRLATAMKIANALGKTVEEVFPEVPKR